MSDYEDNSKQVDLNKSQQTRNFSDKFKTIQQQVFAENQESDCFQTIFESAAIGIAKVALHGKWLKVNRKVCEITGYSEDELLKLSFQDITHSDDLEADLEQVLNLLMGEINFYSLEKRYIRADGSIVWVKVNSSLVKEADNSEYFIVTIEDITNRKRIEKNQRLDYQALSEMTERYQLAVGDSDIGIWDWNLESGDCYFSSEWKKILGYEDEELVDNIDTFFSNLHPEDYLKVEAAIKEHFVQRTPLDIEYRMLNKCNQYIWVRNQARAIWDESRNPIRIAGCIRDIEHLKQVEADLSLTRERAEKANLVKSEFLSKMTHELRTPLNGILGFTQVLQRQSNLEEEQRQYLDTILRCGNNLLDLINDILDIYQIEAGAIQLNTKEFDLYKIIDFLEQMLQIKCKSKGLQLNFQLDKDVPQYIKTDESRLRQVLTNLLDNAIKFTDTGSICLQITKYTVNNRGDCCRLCFQIRDTGRGIIPEDLDIIFDAFGQSKNIQEYPNGSGLGLAISKIFIEMMGGEIKIESSLGKGTTVEFDVIVSTVAKDKINQYSPKPGIVCLASEQPKPLILIAEDDKDNHQLLVETLCKTGFEIIQASNGKEAVEKWQEYKPNLILMDMRMPIMDGLKATHEIRASAAGQNTKIIIAQTANAFNEDKKLIMSLGCDDFISKPFKEQDLLEKIGHLLKVKYIYSNEQQCLAVEEEQIQINSESLKFMSSEWNLKLYQAASVCNQKAVTQLLAQIPEGKNSLIKQYLVNLANKFQFDEIVNLVSSSKVIDYSSF